MEGWYTPCLLDKASTPCVPLQRVRLVSRACTFELEASECRIAITKENADGRQPAIFGELNLASVALEALFADRIGTGACHRKRLRRPFLRMGGTRVRIWPITRRCGPRGAAWASQRPPWPLILAAGGPGEPSAHARVRKKALNAHFVNSRPDRPHYLLPSSRRRATFLLRGDRDPTFSTQRKCFLSC